MKSIYLTVAVLLFTVTAHAGEKSRLDDPDLVWTKEMIQEYFPPEPVPAAVDDGAGPKPAGPAHKVTRFYVPPGFQGAHQPGNAQTELEQGPIVTACVGTERGSFVKVDEFFHRVEPFQYYTEEDCVNFNG